jgi:hypothetical protein
MATVHYRNAKILVNGVLLSTFFNELAIQYGAEMLDETAFGDTTRINKGGLFTATITGKGFIELGSNSVEELLFALVGLDGTPLVLFPDGIIEGSATGFGMLATISAFNLAPGTVGTLYTFDFSAASRGIDP